jgi:hypothetical protein
MQIGNSLVTWTIREYLVVTKIFLSRGRCHGVSPRMIWPTKERGQARLPDLETLGLA